MDMRDPTALVHEYIQRMMAWLLFVEPDTVAKRQAVQLGLGAGSLTKFCAKVLRMKTTAIELNPQVLAACRGWFKLPADTASMQVILADAAQEIQQPEWWGTVDALQVDLYDHEAAAPVLDSAEFYAHCRRLLTEDGCMTVNLFGRSSSFAQERGQDRQRLRPAKPSGPSRRRAKATPWCWRSARPSRPKRAELAERAEIIQTQWGLPAVKWLRGFKPITDVCSMSAHLKPKAFGQDPPRRPHRTGACWWSGCRPTA